MPIEADDVSLVSSNEEVEYEVDLNEAPKQIDADGADDEAQEAAPQEEAAEEPVVEVPPAEDPRISAALAQLEAKQRQFDEAIQRATQPKVEEGPPSQPPVDPSKITTQEEWAAYHNWQRAHDLYQARLIARQEASSVQSELRIRGELNAESMGPGYTYDEVIEKYYKPLEKSSPALKVAVEAMADPSAARYSIGLMAKLGEAKGGNRVKAMQGLRDYLEGKTGEGAEIVQKINKAVEKNQAKIQHKAGAAKATKKKTLTAEDIYKMSDDEYVRWRNQRGSAV